MAIETFKFINLVGTTNDKYFYIKGKNYRKAADKLRAEIILKEKDTGEKDINLYIPWITIQAFSCELYLKSILIEEGKAYNKTHSLRKLFCTINGKKQTDILDRTKTAFLGKVHQNSESYNFCRLLRTISNSFEDWRYCIEEKKEIEINLTFLDCFSHALKNHIDENSSYDREENIAIIKVLDE